jgi:hypothetical protein
MHDNELAARVVVLERALDEASIELASTQDNLQRNQEWLRNSLLYNKDLQRRYFDLKTQLQTASRGYSKQSAPDIDGYNDLRNGARPRADARSADAVEASGSGSGLTDDGLRLLTEKIYKDQKQPLQRSSLYPVQD